ncbi:MAG: hypothetical protein AAB391_00230 [Patescibacteria group bacterium]
MARIRSGRKFEQFLLGDKAVDLGGPIPDIPFEPAWQEVLRVQVSRFDWDTKKPKTLAGQALFQAVAAELPNEAWRNALELYVAVGLAFDRRHHADCAFLVNGMKRVGVDLTVEEYPYKLAKKRRAAESSPIPMVILTRAKITRETGFAEYGREIAAKLLHGTFAHERLLRQIRDHDFETVRRSMARRRR